MIDNKIIIQSIKQTIEDTDIDNIEDCKVSLIAIQILIDEFVKNLKEEKRIKHP